jgi:hypothetical protein
MHILVNPARREPVTGKECFCIDWYLQRRHDNLENSLVIDAISLNVRSLSALNHATVNADAG